jgi:hypothetical protein
MVIRFHQNGMTQGLCGGLTRVSAFLCKLFMCEFFTGLIKEVAYTSVFSSLNQLKGLFVKLWLYTDIDLFSWLSRHVVTIHSPSFKYITTRCSTVSLKY